MGDAKTFEAYCTTMFCRCCRRLLCFLIQKFFIHKNNIAIGRKYLYFLWDIICLRQIRWKVFYDSRCTTCSDRRHYCNGHWTSLVYDHIRSYPSTNLSIFLMVTYTTYTIHLASKKIDNRETISCIIICLNGIRSTA